MTETSADAPGLARRLGLFDATMIVMGGIIGSGIFVTPAVVAQKVHTPALILGAWVLGGVIALIGAFIYAELAARRPHVGGQYAYMRDAYHPAVAFVYGWALLLVIQTGGMAAVAITFARYFREVTELPLGEPVIASLAVALLVAVNCLGVRSGSTVQNLLMVLKILAVLGVVAAGLLFARGGAAAAAAPVAAGGSTLLAFGAAMAPVMFSFGGWQTASFVAGEMRDPRRDLARGLLIGVLGVIALYLAVNLACLSALGADGLRQSAAPATAVLRLAFGERGADLIAVGIAISALGFLSQSMLTAPRVYYAMAEDRVFFRQVAWIDPRSRAPVVAIVLQGVFTLLIALSGSYEQILNYVVPVDFVFFGLTAGTVFVFRRRREPGADPDARIPAHPATTAVFIVACALIVAATVYAAPLNAAIGLGIMLTGVPAYLIGRGRLG